MLLEVQDFLEIIGDCCVELHLGKYTMEKFLQQFFRLLENSLIKYLKLIRTAFAHFPIMPVNYVRDPM